MLRRPHPNSTMGVLDEEEAVVLVLALKYNEGTFTHRLRPPQPVCKCTFVVLSTMKVNVPSLYFSTSTSTTFLHTAGVTQPMLDTSARYSIFDPCINI